MDYYLKFTDEAEAQSVLYVQDEVEQVLNELSDEPVVDPLPPQPKYRNIDAIGTIYKQTGETTQQEGPGGEPIEVPVLVALDGYHVNVRIVANEDPTDLEPYRVYPSTPSRVWA